jgi:carbon storage regulator
MLVLSRQRDETIMIGDEIEITVVDIRGDKVRLGITAPTRIAVHRKEVYEAIRKENEEASRVASADLPNMGQVLAPGPGRNHVSASPVGPRAPSATRASRLSAGAAPPLHAPPPALGVTSPPGAHPSARSTARPA